MPTHASPTALSCSRSLCACHCGISVHSTKCANTRESGASAAGRGGGPAGPCSGPADPSAALSESAAAAASSGEAAGAAAEGRSGEGVALWRRLATSQSPRRNSSCVSSTSSNCASSCAAESGAAGSTMRYRFSAVAVRTSETLMPDGIRPVSRSSKANSRQRAVRSGAGCLWRGIASANGRAAASQSGFKRGANLPSTARTAVQSLSSASTSAFPSPNISAMLAPSAGAWRALETKFAVSNS
mmetsp:Transcript_11617/g.29435  ORF Transcript_11617/g.29435 Transcript_11617/m.29435 type:complete len:243 (-) Transcript_11617:1335-2063(-)